jgi:LysR family transcriptional activator of mexEF-oprN operon
MKTSYGRDLDLNLLRVFVVVAEAGSVTAAAGRLYLTQPAVSAALRRLATAVGAPLFARAGRGLTLTARGQRLLRSARPHLEALVAAALSPEVFDPKTTERTVRLGVSDAGDAWLLPPLLRALGREAPRLRLVVVSVQFRTIAEALASSRVDLAVTVADDLPVGTARRTLYHGGFVCLFDPRHARLGKRPTLERYLAHEHVVVSYNDDLRGIVEDMLGVKRRVRVSLATFHSVGAVVDGTSLVATVPAMAAKAITSLRPHLRTAPVPLSLSGAPMELVWRSAVDDDDAVRLVRDLVVRIAEAASRGAR